MKYTDITTELVENNKSIPITMSFCSLKNIDCIENEFIDTYLDMDEKDYYNKLKYDARKTSYLLGRVSSKRAIASYMDCNDYKSISIEKGIFCNPIVKCNNHNITVTITHTKHIGMAAATKEFYPIGIDIEGIDKHYTKAIKTQLTDNEIQLVEQHSLGAEVGFVTLWTIKEALSKVLRIGFLTSLKTYEVERIEGNDYCINGYYKNFKMFKSTTYKVDKYLVTICYPAKCDLKLNYETVYNAIINDL